VGYLAGSVSFARIVGRFALPGVDLSSTEFSVPGSDDVWTYRGVSATSVLDRAGPGWGVVVIVLDALKAFTPTLLFRLLVPDSPAFAITAVAVVVGHVWPVWWRFRGGRGQSSMLGATLAIDVLAVVFATVVGAVLGVIVFTSVYLARNVSPLLLAPWFLLVAGVGPAFWYAVGVAVVYVVAVRGDVAEELRTRAARGIPSLPYGARLRTAWHDFLHEK
jgi:glycerol-3-phosphate acyltransferase PlsY